MDVQNIPIFINNRNRLEYLKDLISWLESCGHTNITVLDNASTYKQLLKYYKTFPYRVVDLGRNYGHLALWKSGTHNFIDCDYYVYTDPDVVPVESCPKDTLSKFIEALEKYPDIDKVGFSLKIDDLPSNSTMTAEILEWEKPNWRKKRDENFFEAPIDTTFAVYRRSSKGGHELNALRSTPPYEARHMPWYRDKSKFTKEDWYYIRHTQTSTHWTQLHYGPAKKARRFIRKVINETKKYIQKSWNSK